MTDLLKYADVGAADSNDNERTSAVVGGNAYDDGTGYQPVLSEEVRKNTEAQSTGFITAVQSAFTSGDNFAYQAAKRLYREANVPEYDPNYNADNFLKLHPDIPKDFQTQFKLAGSELEANWIYKDMQKQMQDQELLARRGGFSTFVARGLAGLVDIDTPLMLLSGGAEAAGKTGLMATRFGRMATGAAVGGSTQVGGAFLAQEASTTPDWTSIPVAGISGAFLGSLGGAFGKLPEDEVNASLHEMQKEFGTYVEKGAGTEQVHVSKETHVTPEENMYQAGKQPQVFDPSKTEITETDLPDTTTGAGSVGAASNSPIAKMEKGRSKAMAEAAEKRDQQLGVSDHLWLDETQLANAGKYGAQAAEKVRWFQKGLAASPIKSEFDRWAKSSSSVARMFMYDALESPSGLLRNNRSAAAIMRHYEQKLSAHMIPYDDAYKMYANLKQPNKWKRAWNETDLKEQFNREVIHELQARAYDPPGTMRAVDPAVRKAADTVDAFHETDLAIGQGRPGEISVKGYEQLQKRPGYFTQRWAGWKMRNVMNKGFEEKDIVQAVAEGYLNVHKTLKPDMALKMAQAVVNRARAMEDGMDANLISILQQDGREFLADALRNNGMKAADIEKLIDDLSGGVAERGQQGHTKGRNDIDMRFTASNGIKMMDLFDTDVEKILSRRARGTAGSAALARKGLASRADLNDLKQAILDEQRARRDHYAGARGPDTLKDKALDALEGDKDLTAEDIDGMLSFFSGGAPGGGLSAGWSIARKLTDLALLNQMGLTQLAETGAQMASVGISRWLDHAPAALKEALGNPKSPLVQELEHTGILLPEERLFRPDLALDIDKEANMSSELVQLTQRWLNRGRRLQGTISGFNAVRNFQHRIAVTGMLDKLSQNMHGMAKDMSAARAYDIGLDEKTWNNIAEYFQNGIVSVDAKGRVQKLNLDKWKPDHAEDLIYALNRHADQAIQRAMAGESNLWFHKDGIASMLTHLKSFTMLALEKQTMRNLRIADGQALNTFTLGLASAAAAYMARQAINGQTQNLTPGRIANGALNYSNMTGWIPMWANPIGILFGIDSIKANPYVHGYDNSLISIPPTVSTINRMSGIPSALLHAVSPFQDMDTNDINAIQATPLIGNMVGMAAVLNGLKAAIREEKASTKSETRDVPFLTPITQQ